MPSDIFSFGIVLYELITGERPNRGRNRTLRYANLPAMWVASSHHHIMSLAACRRCTICRPLAMHSEHLASHA